MTRRALLLPIVLGCLAVAVPAAPPPKGADAPLNVLKTSKVPKERLEAVRALQKLDDPRIVPALIDAFNPLDPKAPENDWFVRKAACKALASKGAGVIEPLKKVLADKDHIVRSRALVTLAMMKAPGVLEILQQHLKTDPDWQVRLECVLQLRDLGDKKAVPALKAAAKEDKHPGVKERAAKVAAKLESGA